ncbi:hypothetical protein DQ04_03591000 [Trypanosoma grayi]|uniref:hypothetical protein n=1 Tax=Trypanosoma grayi TaxID=71804 RepID=UPI0004F46B20|nr:hypothetical protein DQ04_03591000 [Trypanosoma grayi]KEG10545.1 hypothetical protein DQ04_03591000 [Trypanosoma grayi]
MHAQLLRGEDADLHFAPLEASCGHTASKPLPTDKNASPKWNLIDVPTQSSEPSSFNSSSDVSLKPHVISGDLGCTDAKQSGDAGSVWGHAEEASASTLYGSVLYNGGPETEEEVRGPRAMDGEEKEVPMWLQQKKRVVLRESICRAACAQWDEVKRETTPIPTATTPSRRLQQEKKECSVSQSLSGEAALRATSVASSRSAPSITTVPHHTSVFYPDGIEEQPPVLLHYLALSGWRTVAGGWDYFSHRRLEKGETVGHAVRWLHSARPRDRFVFVISPVERKAEGETVGMWGGLRDRVFGPPPAFAYKKGKLLKQPTAVSPAQAPHELLSPSARPLSPVARRGGGNLSRSGSGVEVVEVRHEDVTALDYSPRLLSSRFAIETKAVYAYFFVSMEAACAYYDSLEDLDRIEEQIERGVTNITPQVRPDQTIKSGSSCSFALDHLISTAGPVETEAATEVSHLGKNDRESSASPQNDAATESPDNVLGADEWDVEQAMRGVRFPVVEIQAPRCKSPELMQRRKQKLQSTSHLTISPVAPLRRVALGETPFLRHRVMSTPTTVHFDTIVTVYSEDPNFNAVLRELLMPEPGTHPYTASLREQRRMLSMYETGMPSWTVFLASTGLPYRRVFRLTFVGLVNIWPVISLFVGLYDLYKHLPQMKAFVSTTLAPLLEWVEHRVTLRVSMLVTYILSVCLTVVTSFTSFLSQFYVLEIILFPLRLIGRLLQTPFALVFDLLWTFFSIIVSFLSLVLVTIKMLFVGPFLLVTHLAALDFGGTTVLPAAAEGTSLTMKWWRAWQEFWVTVASPVKNLAKAWYDSVVHVAVSAARREASIRRWYTPKLRSVGAFVEWVRELCAVNLTLWWQLWGPGWDIWLVNVLLIVYSAWVLLYTSGGSSANGVGTSAAASIGGVAGSDLGAMATDETALMPVASTVAEAATTATAVEPFIEERLGFSLMMVDPPLGGDVDALYFAWETLLAVWIQLPW